MSDRSEGIPVAVDNPINMASEDRLGRNETARSFVRQVLEMDVSQGLTVGVFGPWGSGKTSFINLAKEDFKAKDITVVDFNPWMFSNPEQLVTRFFMELSGSLQRNEGWEAVGKVFRDYGGAVVGAVNLVSIAFAGIPALGQVLGSLVEQLEKSANAKGVNELREDVEKALTECDRPLVVVLDDVDRLSFPEIRDVFKLVRLTASFPNLIYVVACDRHRVEQALEETGQHGAYGRDYLEKIIQFPFDLPQVPRHLLEEQFDEALRRAVPDLESLRDGEIWPEIHEAIVEPLIENMRDVIRYAAAVRATVRDLRGKAAIDDVLGLEAVRLFLPDVFKLLHEAVDALTYPAHSRTAERELARFRRSGIGPDPQSKKLVEDILSEDKDHRSVVEGMLKYLFPYGDLVAQAPEGELWDEDAEHAIKGDRRVADEAVMRVYLERVESHDILMLTDAERMVRLMEGEPEELDAFLRSLDTRRLVDAIREFCGLSDRYRPEHAQAGAPTLLNLIPERPNQATLRRMVISAVFRLLSAIDSEGQVEELVKSILRRSKGCRRRSNCWPSSATRSTRASGLCHRRPLLAWIMRWRRRYGWRSVKMRSTIPRSMHGWSHSLRAWTLNLLRCRIR